MVIGKSNDGVHSAAEARAEFVYAPMCAPRAERNALTVDQSNGASANRASGSIRLQ
ncbi:hypothetical protein GCM10008097_19190 [Mycetocola manganoxydans]|nr:hypothetical protein GCM10008097_19190 [Mycetocola manganoxydans]